MEDSSILMGLRQIEAVASSHPLLRGLLRDVPFAHSVWTKEQQHQWLKLAASIFTVLYEESDVQQQQLVSRL